MTRNWHVTSRPALGAQPLTGSLHGKYAPHGSIIPFAASPPLERSVAAQALIDIGAVLFAVLFVSLSAVSVGVAFAILFFCEL